MQHPRFLIDGLLRIEDLSDDWWEVDVRTGRVRGERSQRVIAMGSRIKVVISEVDVSARQLGLAASDDTQPGRRETRKSKDGGRKTGRGKGRTPAKKTRTTHRKGRSRRR